MFVLFDKGTFVPISANLRSITLSRIVFSEVVISWCNLQLAGKSVWLAIKDNVDLSRFTSFPILSCGRQVLLWASPLTQRADSDQSPLSEGNPPSHTHTPTPTPNGDFSALLRIQRFQITKEQWTLFKSCFTRLAINSARTTIEIRSVLWIDPWRFRAEVEVAWLTEPRFVLGGFVVWMVLICQQQKSSVSINTQGCYSYSLDPCN